MQALLLLAEGGEGPNTELLWLLGILLGFFALSIISGWVSALRTPEPARAEEEAVTVHEHTEADVPSKLEGGDAKALKGGRRKK